MAEANARQWQRFSYNAEVQLRWAASSVEHCVPGGRCIDLSRGGVQLRADDAPEVGAAVSCELASAGSVAVLPGRVCWRKAAPDSEGAQLGIEFAGLSAEQEERVGALLASIEGRAGQSVQLRLGAFREPLTALAEPTERGMRLRAPLPLVVAGSEVEFELLDPPMRFAGRVVSSRLHAVAGAQPWELEVLVEERSTPRARRYTMYQNAKAPRRIRGGVTRRPTLHGAVPPMAAQVQGTALATVAGEAPLAVMRERHNTPLMAADDQRHAQLVAAERSRHAQLAQLTRGAPLSAADGDLPAIPKARGPRVFGLVVLAGLALALSQLAYHPNVPTHVAAGSATPPKHFQVPRVPSAIPAEPVLPPTAAHDDPPQAAAVAAPTALATVQPTAAPPIENMAAAPTIKVADDVTEIFVPTNGSLAGMLASVWTDPFALVIELPQAKVALAKTRYPQKTGGIKQITVAELHGATQLRIYLDALLARYTTEPASGGLAIRLRRDLRPLPQ